MSSGQSDAEILTETVDALVAAWSDDILASDLATKLTCAEVEVLADLMKARGEESAAEMWLELHAAGDKEGDYHYKQEAGA